MSALPEVVPSYGQLARTDPSVFLGLDLPIVEIFSNDARLADLTSWDPLERTG